MITNVGMAQNGIVINPGTNMQLFSGTTLVIGNDLGLINNSASTVFEGTVVFSGSAAQEIGGSENTVFSILDIDNSNGVFISKNTRVIDELILTDGILDINDFNLILSDVSVISGSFSSSNMINTSGTGVLTKEVNGNDNFILPVGDLSSLADYSPVEIDFTAGTYTNGYVSIGVKNEKHTDNPSTSDYLNRYWNLSSAGISDFSCDMTFTYVSDDIVGNESNIIGAAWDNSTWNNLGQASSLQFSGTIKNFADITGVESQFVGLNNVINNDLSVYYSNGIIFINSATDLKLQNVEVFDAVGRLIRVESVTNTGNEEISFSNIPGYYLLKINTESSFIIKKILVN